MAINLSKLSNGRINALFLDWPATALDADAAVAELGRLDAQVLIVGGGTMGADVAVVLRRGGYAVTVLEQQAERRAGLRERFA